MDDHLSPARLAQPERTPAEADHLASCVRCRLAERRIAEFVATAGADATSPGAEIVASSAFSDPGHFPAEHLGPGTRLDRYQILGTLGEGGMAVVYRARHLQLGSEHAIKVLTVPSRQIRDRLLVEGRAQATLRHRNIVPVTDVIDVHGAPGLVMERVDGPTLSDLLRRGRLPLDQVDALVRGILAGVAAAHRAGLIHRDLKPANILLEQTEEGLVPKVTDFGLAKVLDAADADDPELPKTRSSAVLGTPRYMAPEQIRWAKAVDRRADVWSIGAILYEMITGTPAFDGPDVVSVLVAVTEGRFRPIRELAPEAPAAMLAAVDAALRVDRDQRVADVEELARIWRGEGAVSPRAMVGPPSPDAPRRSRWWMAVPAGGAMASVALLAWWSVGFAPRTVPCDPLPASYNPLAVGNWWHYSVTDVESGRDKGDKWLKLDQEQDLAGPNAGIRGFLVHRTDGEGSADRWLGRKDGVVAWIHDEWRDKDGKLTRSEIYRPSRTRVDERCEHRVAGAHWVEEFDDVQVDPVVWTPQETVHYVVEWTVEAVDDVVTVPAGTFHAIRLHRKAPDEDQLYWFSAGVGKVREDNRNKDREALLEYHLEQPP